MKAQYEIQWWLKFMLLKGEADVGYYLFGLINKSVQNLVI